jgi:hypothetical protein
MDPGYLALAFIRLSDQNLARLPTTKLLVDVHERVASTTSAVTLTGTAPRLPVGRFAMPVHRALRRLTIALCDACPSLSETLRLPAVGRDARGREGVDQ